ncbi:MAG: hypothetical protein Q9173_007205, partial [Seirophora scorigena]
SVDIAMAGTNPFRRRDNAGVSHTQHKHLTVAADRAELRFPPIETQELSPVDPFSAPSDEGTSHDDDDDLRRNTIANAATSTPPLLPSLSMPVKTARKALALDLGANASTASEPPAQTGLSFSASTAKRPHYDVDDFKRLLLTGEGIRPDNR